MPLGVRGSGTGPSSGRGGYAVDPWRSARRTLGAAGYGRLVAPVTAYVSHPALRRIRVPVAVGGVLSRLRHALLSGPERHRHRRERRLRGPPVREARVDRVEVGSRERAGGAGDTGAGLL
ncbi:hypothetical protein ACFX45_01210 [Streptomyces sp. YIM B13518]